MTYDDVIGLFRALVPFTSILFAIAQYYENRQRKIIEPIATNIWDELGDLKKEQNTTTGTASRIRGKTDKLVNEAPLNNQIIIIALWVVFIAHATILAIVSWPWMPAETLSIVCKYAVIAFKFSTGVLWILCGALTYTMYKMNEQLSRFREERSTIKDLYEAYCQDRNGANIGTPQANTSESSTLQRSAKGQPKQQPKTSKASKRPSRSNRRTQGSA